MQRILEINSSLSTFEQLRDSFKKNLDQAPYFETDEVQLTPERIEAFDQLVSEFKKVKKNIVEKINVALILEGKSAIR